MRKATWIATALIAVLALSVGAFAYPVVVGTHPLSTVHSGSPGTVNHPTTGDNSTGNETNDNETGDHEAPPAANETENETADNETLPIPAMPEFNDTEMGNISVEHNVTVTQEDSMTSVNGTIVVVQGNVTLVDLSFQIVVHDNGTANVTFNGTETVGSMSISVRGLAVYSPERRTVDVFGVATATQNGTVQWQRTFDFETPSDCSNPA